MAISWGAWSSNNRLRCGVEVLQSPTSVTSATTSVTITRKVYLQTRYASFESGSSDTWFFTGSGTDLSGNTDWDLGDMGTKLMGSDAETVTLQYGSTQTWSQSGRVHSYYAYPGTDATSSQSLTIPARPYAVPSAPSSVSVTRNSDSQDTVTWTRNSTTGAPYSSQVVEMRAWSGSAWGSWAAVATVSGSATSYVKTGQVANRIYQFRVKATNSAGSSGYGTSGNAWHTPAAPTNVVSAVNASGTQITTSWDDNAYSGTTPPVTFQLERSVAGGAYALYADDLTASPYTDTTPGAGTNQYRVLAEVETLSPQSAYGVGNSVSTIVPPLAPTNLDPTGVAKDLSQNLTLTWQHNPGGDGAAQTHYTIEISTNGGSSWSTLTGANDVASATSSHTITGGTLTNGTAYQWRVKTQGATGAAYGPVSAAATLTGSAKPVVNVTTPGATVTALPMSVAWTYTQAQGSPQASWTAVLKQGGVTLETKTGTGTGLTTSFAYPVVDGAAYTVELTATSAAGVTSSTDTQATTVSLPVPAPVTLTPEYQPCTGTVLLSVVAAAPGVGQAAVDHVIIERRVDGGDWVTLSDSMAPNADFLDTLPLLNGLNEYRATGVSTAPSYSVNAVEQVVTTGARDSDTGLWVFLSYGPGFSGVLRARRDPRIDDVSNRTRAAQSFLGREKPLLFVGENTNYGVTFAGSLHYSEDCAGPVVDCRYDSAPWAWHNASRAADVVCYRDYTGRRVFGMLGDVQCSEVLDPGMGTVSFSVTETGYTETYTGG